MNLPSEKKLVFTKHAVSHLTTPAAERGAGSVAVTMTMCHAANQIVCEKQFKPK